jgi:dienelactone hydrolase
MLFNFRISLKFWNAVIIIQTIISSVLYAQDDTLPLNKVIENVVCHADNEQSYALFLPPNYSSEKKWPIIYALDAGARGKIPVELFKDAASQYGYIIVGSNNSQNGPWEPILHAIKAVWEDTHSRLSIDEKRVYSVGFSGGARAAALMTQLNSSSITACILCGAGLPPNFELHNIKSVYIIGVIGLKDFNYLEMMELHQKIIKEAIPHRFIIMDGYHTWPEDDICMRIVEWFEIHAMSVGKITKNENFIESIYEKELAVGHIFENEKNFYRAYFHYTEIISLFKELMETHHLDKRIAKVMNNSKFYQQSMNDLTSRQMELEILGRIYQVLAGFEKRPLVEISEEKFLKELGFFSLMEYVQNPDDPDMVYMATRLLTQISMQMSAAGWNAMEKKEYIRAINAFNICLKTSEKEPESRQAYYDVSLACAYGASNDDQNALKYLRIGIEHGYNKISFLMNADFFQKIRETNEFKDIITTIKP